MADGTWGEATAAVSRDGGGQERLWLHPPEGLSTCSATLFQLHVLLSGATDDLTW